MRKQKATRAQCSIADMNQIPRKLAHTINIERSVQYKAWLRSAEAKLQKFLDGMESQRYAILGEEDQSNACSVFD